MGIPSLSVQWLGLRAFTAGAQVQSLVGELKSHKLWGAAKKKGLAFIIFLENIQVFCSFFTN